VEEASVNPLHRRHRRHRHHNRLHLLQKKVRAKNPAKRRDVETIKIQMMDICQSDMSRKAGELKLNRKTMQIPRPLRVALIKMATIGGIISLG
jgi:hypothetical protein